MKQSRPLLMIAPSALPGQRLGQRLASPRPMWLKAKRPPLGLTRWATVVRRAPESAAETMDGMGAMTALPDLGDDPAPAPGNIWGTLSNAVTSDAFKGLVNAGATFYSSQKDADAARDAATRARKQAALEAQAMQAQFDANLAAHRTAQAGSSGSSWLMPAGIAGVAGLGLILFFALKKKRK